MRPRQTRFALNPRFALLVATLTCTQIAADCEGDDDDSSAEESCVIVAGAGGFETIQAAIDAARSHIYLENQILLCPKLFSALRDWSELRQLFSAREPSEALREAAPRAGEWTKNVFDLFRR